MLVLGFREGKKERNKLTNFLLQDKKIVKNFKVFLRGPNRVDYDKMGLIHSKKVACVAAQYAHPRLNFLLKEPALPMQQGLRSLRLQKLQRHQVTSHCFLFNRQISGCHVRIISSKLSLLPLRKNHYEARKMDE